MPLSAALVERLCPTAREDLVAAVVVNWAHAEAKGINTPLRTQMFLATIAVETGGLRSIDENLHYTTAKRLMEVWPSRFTSTQAAQPYLRNPERLANTVYANRLGNGPPSSGDGWRYRGGGFIQVTGRENYRRVGHENAPETLRQPGPGFKAAVDWWFASGCNQVADKNDATAMRKKVNGGTNGLAEFKDYLAKAKQIFTSVAPSPPAPKPRPQPDEPAPEITEKDVKQTGRQAGGLVIIGAILAAIVSKMVGLW